MMLHRHFSDEKEKRANMTTLSDVTPKEKEFVSAVFPPDEEPVEAPKAKRGRPKKSAE